jgi:divalent metal cation (Fe/Co/Zn/Cd) transporter
MLVAFQFHLVSLIFAFFLSIFFTLILTYFFKRRAPGPFGGMLYFFAIVFLFTLAIGVWISPQPGPRIMDIPWVSLIGIGLLITLLLAEMLPHRETKLIKVKQDAEDEEVLEKEFGALAWVMIIVLVAAVIIGALYLHRVQF